MLAQFLLFALYFMDPIELLMNLPEWISYVSIPFLVIGVLVIAMGIIHLNDNLTALPSPKKNAELISNGIYKYVRHPIYLGILISMFAFSFYALCGFKLLISFLLTLVFYFKSVLEEKYLVERFEAYQLYKENTGRFLPKCSFKSSRLTDNNS